MTLTNGSLTVIFNNNEVVMARNDHPKWNDIISAYRCRDEYMLRNLLSLKKVIEIYTYGDLTVENTGVIYKGRKLHTIDAQRVMSFLKEGLPYQPIANYMAKKMRNPSARAIQEMYSFLEHKNMALTPDGNFIAYKGVRDDFYSVYGNLETVVVKGKVDKNGHIFNGVGEIIEVERSSVDDNYKEGCSFGLHIGSLNYALTWGTRTILVETNPENVVSVPEDSQCQKCRCCGYEVKGEYIKPLPNTYTSEFVNKPVEYTNEQMKYFQQGFETGKYCGINQIESYYQKEDELKSTDPIKKAYINGYLTAYKICVPIKTI